MAVTLKNKPPVAELDAALRRAGFRHGDYLEFHVSRKEVTIVARPIEDDEYTPAERRAIDRNIARSEKEYAAGKGAGPFDTAEALAASMEADIKRLRIARRKAKSAR